MENYAIKIYSNHDKKRISTVRYILSCDEHWYETTPYPGFYFTKQQCLDLVPLLKGNFIYNFTFIDENENEVDWFLSDNQKSTEQKKKKSFISSICSITFKV